MNLIFLGPPGAGKGTIAQHIMDDFKLIQISSGDLLRALAKEETDLGREIKKHMEAGALVPDEVVLDLMKKRLSESDSKNGFILDGFPRNVLQAEELHNYDLDIDKVVNFQVPDELVIRRITGRRTSKSTGKIFNIYPECSPNPPEGYPEDDLMQRADDNEETVKRRLVHYKELTEPLIEYYEKKGMLINVDATAPLNDIVESVKKGLASL